MQYIDSFNLATENDEVDYILSYPAKLEMSCYADNIYPFKIYPQKQLSRLDFEPVTMFYGGNGSGKSTLLNIIAQKLELDRSAPFNNTPFIKEYLKFCRYRLTFGKKPPSGSRIITSDDVFDYLLDIRSINDGIENRREELFEEYGKYTDPNSPTFQMKSLNDYEELKRRNEARSGTKSAYTRRRIPKELVGKSNGESAFAYFTQEIEGDALYLLDEPENSLSPKLQIELSKFLADSVRFYNCQFIISTHSPFMLSMRGAKIYDLDTIPVQTKQWTELQNVREYYNFFQEHRDEFKL